MKFFEYPYVIITILVIIIFVMGIVGLYFVIKSSKTARETVEKSFCGIGKIQADFERAQNTQRDRSVIYISISLDSLKRIHPVSKAHRVHENLKNILLRHFSLYIDGEIALYGTEGFVAFNKLGADELTRRIDRCFDEINSSLVMHGAVNVVRMNFGYHMTASADVSFETVLKRAKHACSMAEDKKILYCRWDSSNGKEFERKISIENSILDEIENNRFFLEYQPILDAKTDMIVGAEVLSRLNSPTEGILTPSVFLSAVNNVGLNREFDYYIFEKNCKWISSDKNRRMKYTYTINFSRSTLCDENLAEKIISIVDRYGIDYSCIAIEILEDKSLDRTDRASMIKNLSTLKKKGILILLDDFGKGHTGFSDLSEFDVSIVKIDKSITGNAYNPTGFLILKNIIKTAHDLGFRTLCEGVETEEQKKTVMDAGCDMLQGYHFYRPLPVTKFEALFDRQ